MEINIKAFYMPVFVGCNIQSSAVGEHQQVQLQVKINKEELT